MHERSHCHKNIASLPQRAVRVTLHRRGAGRTFVLMRRTPAAAGKRESSRENWDILAGDDNTKHTRPQVTVDGQDGLQVAGSSLRGIQVLTSI